MPKIILPNPSRFEEVSNAILKCLQSRSSRNIKLEDGVKMRVNLGKRKEKDLNLAQFVFKNPKTGTKITAHNLLLVGRTKDGEVYSLPAEAFAAAQSMVSRSSGDPIDRFEQILADGAGDFVKKYYVGYGHKSIADCVSIVISIHKLSIEASYWVLEQAPLLNPQELSTRYNTEGIEQARSGLAKLPRRFQEYENLETFKRVHNALIDIVESVYEPVRNTSFEYYFKRYEKINASAAKNAANAHACDIARGFLPTATDSSITISANVRAITDLIHRLYGASVKVPYLAEVALDIARAVVSVAPNSLRLDQFALNRYIRVRQETEEQYRHKPDPFKDWTIGDRMKNILLEERIEIPVPLEDYELSECSLKRKMDFGSIRDIIRHRTVFSAVLTESLHERDFHDGYFRGIVGEPLKKELRKIVGEPLREYYEAVNSFQTETNLSPERSLGLALLGHKFPFYLWTSNSSGLYNLFRLRMKGNSHPLLREEVFKIAEQLGCGGFSRAEIGVSIDEIYIERRSKDA